MKLHGAASIVIAAWSRDRGPNMPKQKAKAAEPYPPGHRRGNLLPIRSDGMVRRAPELFPLPPCNIGFAVLHDCRNAPGHEQGQTEFTNGVLAFQPSHEIPFFRHRLFPSLSTDRKWICSALARLIGPQSRALGTCETQRYRVLGLAIPTGKQSPHRVSVEVHGCPAP